VYQLFSSPEIFSAESLQNIDNIENKPFKMCVSWDRRNLFGGYFDVKPAL
jgi:hypothetical protein